MISMDINEILSSFNENQLKQINQFLNSQQGQKLARPSEADKKKMLAKLSGLDIEKVRRNVKNLTKEDILKMLK